MYLPFIFDFFHDKASSPCLCTGGNCICNSASLSNYVSMLIVFCACAQVKKMARQMKR